MPAPLPPVARAALFAELGALVASAELHSDAEASFSRERVGEPLALAQSPGRTGKILILPGPP